MCDRVVSYNNKLRWKFENVSSLDGNMRYSDEVEIEGVKWKIGIKKTNEASNDWISAFLHCSADEKDKAWICAVDARFFFLKQQVWGCKTELGDNKYFTHEINEFGNYFNQHSFSAIVSPSYGYINNNEFNIQCNFDFIFQNFATNIPNYTDIVLKVEGTEVHSNKELLCSNSKYFHNMLTVEKCDYTKIEMDEDVKLNDFIILLAAMHPKSYLSNTKMFECLELADRFEVHTIPVKIAVGMYSVLDYKQKYNESAIDLQYLFKCIQFADKYDYEKLMAMAMRCFKSSKEIKDFSDLEEFAKLTKNTKLMALNRVLEFL